MHNLPQCEVNATNLGGGVARVDLHAEGLGLHTHPAHQVSQAHNVVAMIVHRETYEHRLNLQT